MTAAKDNPEYKEECSKPRDSSSKKFKKRKKKYDWLTVKYLNRAWGITGKNFAKQVEAKILLTERILPRLTAEQKTDGAGICEEVYKLLGSSFKGASAPLR